MNKKFSKSMVGLAAVATLGLGGTAFFYSSNQNTETKLVKVEERAKLEVAQSKKKYENIKLDSSKKISELNDKVDKSEKEVTSLKKKLEQSKIEEQEEIKAQQLAAQVETEHFVEQINYQEEVPQQIQVETPQVAVSNEVVTPQVSSDDNWHRQNRRNVESTDNYKWDWGNGYNGAYQFTQQTWNATAAAHGLNPSDTSPANQDAMADAYANDRYGGWQNVPTVGGW